MSDRNDKMKHKQIETVENYGIRLASSLKTIEQNLVNKWHVKQILSLSPTDIAVLQSCLNCFLHVNVVIMAKFNTLSNNPKLKQPHLLLSIEMYLSQM